MGRCRWKGFSLCSVQPSFLNMGTPEIETQIVIVIAEVVWKDFHIRWSRPFAAFTAQGENRKYTLEWCPSNFDHDIYRQSFDHAYLYCIYFGRVQIWKGTYVWPQKWACGSARYLELESVRPPPQPRKSILRLIESLNGASSSWGPGRALENWVHGQPWRAFIASTLYLVSTIISYELFWCIISKLIERHLRKSSSTTIPASCLVGNYIINWHGWDIAYPQNGLATSQQQTNSPGLKFRYFMRMPVDSNAHLGCITCCCHMKSWEPFISLKPLTSWWN